MKNLFLFALFLSLFLLFSCSSDKDKLAGVWKVNRVSSPGIEMISKSLKPDIVEDVDAFLQQQHVGSYLALNDDGRYGLSFNRAYEIGTWDYNTDKKEIILKAESGITTRLSVREFDHETLMIRPLAAEKNKTAKNVYAPKNRLEVFQADVEFTRDEFEYENQNENIFSVENNRWRIKPSKAETPEQIKARLKANLYFLKITLKDYVARKADYISWDNIPMPVFFAGNGIALEKQSKLSEEWIEIFYDVEQTYTAYHLMETAFQKESKVDKTLEKFKFYIAVLEELERGL